MPSVTELKRIIQTYKSEMCKPIPSRKADLIEMARNYGLDVKKSDTVSDIKKSIREYRSEFCPPIQKNKEEMLKFVTMLGLLPKPKPKPKSKIEDKPKSKIEDKPAKQAHEVKPKSKITDDVLDSSPDIQKLVEGYHFDYRHDIFRVVDEILDGKYNRIKSIPDNVKETIKLFHNIQSNLDFYQTSDRCIHEILFDIYDNNYHKWAERFIEPCFGTGKFTRSLIDCLNNQNDSDFDFKNSTIKVIDGVEFSREMFDFVKNNIDISNLYNMNFLDFETNDNRYYDLAFVNPPFSMLYREGDKWVNESRFWAFIIAKTLTLQSHKKIEYASFVRINYFILPIIPDPQDYVNAKDRKKAQSGRELILGELNYQFLFKTIPKKTKLKICKILKVDDFEEDIQSHIHSIELIGECSDFKSIDGYGNVKNLGIKTGLYKIITRS